MPIGIIIITKGVLLVNPDNAAIATNSNPVASTGELLASPVTLSANASSVPVRTSAPEIMNIAAIVSGAGLLIAANISSVEIRPRTSSKPAAPIAVTSGGRISVAKAISSNSNIKPTRAGA